jgi:uncharacterized phage-associated protein
MLAYIIKGYGRPSVTSLMKLCYLIDLVSIKKKEPQISSFEYRRYTYGPFDEKIYDKLKTLTTKNIISAESEYTPKGDEFVTYLFNCEDFDFDKLSQNEKKTIDEVLDNLKGYGAKVLTEIAYKTKPMEALDATIDGNENLNHKLNLQAN